MHLLGGETLHLSAQDAEAGTSPSSECSNSICWPMQMPRKGFVAAASITAWRSPRASSSRMQSGIAPWPGTTRSAAARTGIGGDGDRAAAGDVLERLRDRTQVAHAVVDDGNSRHYRTPLVEGMAPPARIGFGGHAQRPTEGLEHGLA